MRLILTLSCPDQIGIVSAVSSFLAQRQCFISESSHYGDPDTMHFFMRTVFEIPPLLESTRLRAEFLPIADKLQMSWEINDVAAPTRTLIMVSRLEHCLSDLLYRMRSGYLAIDVAAVVSNHENVRPLVEWHGIPFHYVPITEETKTEQEVRLLEVIARENVELVVLARYMQILSERVCTDLQGHIINIHHSFLPSFKGAAPYHQAHARGVKLIGATAHYVTTDLDEGPIIDQAVERVTHDATTADLEARGRDIESIVLARAVRYHTERRVLLNGSKTVVFS